MGAGLLALGLALSYRSAGLTGLLAFIGPILLIRYAMKKYLDHTTRSVQELQAHNQALEQANREIQAMTARLQETYAGTLEALVAALDARDRETRGHSVRVSRLTMLLARELGVQEGTREWLDMERGSLLHDIGKIGVADAILRKPGKLADDEWAEMRRHARIGYEMLKDIPFLAGAAEIVACHHERWDGKGYPRGLAGEAIPLGARIFALADAFDAMATDRPYRRARSYEECKAEIVRCAGTQFDPRVVEAFLRVYPRWVEFHRESLRRLGAQHSEVAYRPQQRPRAGAAGRGQSAAAGRGAPASGGVDAPGRNEIRPARGPSLTGGLSAPKDIASHWISFLVRSGSGSVLPHRAGRFSRGAHCA